MQSSKIFRNSIVPFIVVASSFHGSVILLPEAWSADAIEDQIAIARVGDALADAGGDDDHVSGSDLAGREVADFDSASTVSDDIALDGAFDVMPRGGDARLDAGAGDGDRFVGGAVIGLDDVAVLGRGEFVVDVLLPNMGANMHERG